MQLATELSISATLDIDTLVQTEANEIQWLLHCDRLDGKPKTPDEQIDARSRSTTRRRKYKARSTTSFELVPSKDCFRPTFLLPGHE